MEELQAVQATKTEYVGVVTVTGVVPVTGGVPATVNLALYLPKQLQTASYVRVGNVRQHF